ncbi:hypothetical protein [Streptomyces sp. NPDC001985]|uniref:hypothetical protein n=1 Tax=Streptomyces sp. NPDC001985 TaxID=3154406 RepID=UPI0033223712
MERTEKAGARWRGAVAGAGITVALTLVAAGCSDGGGGGASDVASRAVSAVSSATASAGKRLDEIKGGVDARADVRLGSPATDSDGRATVEVSARNTVESAKSFAVRVDYRDSSGNLLDTVVVTVADVAAGATKDATARSNRKLSGEVRAELGTTLRY